MRATFTIGVFGIIRDDQNRVLLCLRNDYDLRNLPGGGLEHWESPREWVIREVKEETGLDVEIKKLIWISSKPDKDEMVFTFECKIIGGQMTLTDESKDIKYFWLHEIPENTAIKQAQRIKVFFENEDELFMRVETGKSSIDLLKEWKL